MDAAHSDDKVIATLAHEPRSSDYYHRKVHGKEQVYINKHRLRTVVHPRDSVSDERLKIWQQQRLLFSR